MFVTPKTYLIGHTSIDYVEMAKFLEDSGNSSFVEQIDEYEHEHLHKNVDADILSSFYAKLCYKSLSLGHNKNISKIRDIESNIKNVIDSGHHSVLEHFYCNFVSRNVSRVFLAELSRHRTGTSFSVNSFRYIRIDAIDLVIPPELEPYKELLQENMNKIEDTIKFIEKDMNIDSLDFYNKKKITSALRRISPNGIAHEVGWGANIRQLRHMIKLRTNRHAEWEIRYVFNEVANILKSKFPLMMYGLKSENIDELDEYTDD